MITCYNINYPSSNCTVQKETSTAARVSGTRLHEPNETYPHVKLNMTHVIDVKSKVITRKHANNQVHLQLNRNLILQVQFT